MPAPKPPAAPIGSVGQRIGGRLVDATIALFLFAIPFLLIPGDRLLARLFVGVVLVTAYEALCTMRSGATVGKVIAGTRVVELDVIRVQPTMAVLRGLLSALATIVLVLAPLLVLASFGASADDRGGTITAAVCFVVLAAGVLVSVFASALRRSFIDRVCSTVVLHRDGPATITTADLLPFAAVQQPPAPSAWGPLARLDQRRRARAARLDNAPLLVLALVVVVFATSVPGIAPGAIAVLGLAWEIVFLVDETWRVSRFGGTAGHLRLGLAVVDVHTGEAPAPLPSFVRALIVSLPLYVLPLGIVVFAVLADDHPLMVLPAIACSALIVGFLVWLRVAPGRGPHDLAAGTVVVSPLRLRDRAERD